MHTSIELQETVSLIALVCPRIVTTCWILQRLLLLCLCK
jgi:hypothetical protein